MPQWNPPIGLPIQYFRRGNRNHDVTAAVILGLEPGGMATIRYTPAKGQPQTQVFVFHDDDPLLKNRTPEWRSEYGTWDYIPGTPKLGYIEDPIVAPAEPERPPAKPQQSGPLQRSQQPQTASR